MIEHKDDPDYEFMEFPEIFNAKNIYEIKDAVMNLYRLSNVLEKNRQENGALRLDRPKLNFSLNNSTGLLEAIGLDKVSRISQIIFNSKI